MNFPDRLLSFHQRHRWLSHAAFWVGLLLFTVGSSRYHDGREATYGFEFLSDGLYLVAEMTGAYALAYWVMPTFFQRKQYVLAGICFLGACYLSCVLARIFIVKICEPAAGVKPKPFETYGAILTDIPKLLYVYLYDIFAVMGMFVLLKVLKDQLLIQKRALLLEKEKAETELKLLKAQLNPHFLFNTLNNIYSLSFISSVRTSESIARLADILDHILYRCNQPFVPLSAEIAVIRNYIELEKLRYDERLTVSFEAEVAEDLLIAPLVLLSLVENAFKHGASEDAGAPAIGIRLNAESGQFFFRITNTVAKRAGGRNRGATPVGEGKRRAKQSDDGKPGMIGLVNLRQQLGLVYGDDHTLMIEEKEGQFIVHLIIENATDAAGVENSQVFARG
jgi:hypothetical protein